MFKHITRFFKGLGFLLLRFESDDIKLARIEGEIREKEAHALNALEEFGSLIAADEREYEASAPIVAELEAKIQALIASGPAGEKAAETLIAEFEEKESALKIIQDRLESNRTALRVDYEQTNRDIEKLRKMLRTIKDGTKRVRAEEKLNELRKATSGKRFEAAGLTDDLSTMHERINERSDKVRGTRMVLDMETSKSASQLETEKVIETATNQSKLARFASNRGIQLKSAQKAAEPAPLGVTPEVEAEKPKA
jgi:chromosome segregation ATPase